MKFLVVGGGAREHAIVDALLHDDSEVYAYMAWENPGIKKSATGYFIGRMDDAESCVKFAKASKTEIAVIGPEAPLAAGFVDALLEAGILCVGPDREHAQLETSKGFTRMLLEKYEIDAQPEYKVFDKDSDPREIQEFLEELGEFVIKPDGLTGGKGVKISGEHLQSAEEGMLYVHEIIGNHSKAIAEEKLEGEEFSLQTLTDGKTFLHFPVAQDHKRAYEEDLGPNTGGMGSYSDANFLLPFLTLKDIETARRITEEVAAAIEKELGSPYKGVMYGGFMITKKGVKLLEYNARFGDPEAMNVLPILKTPFSEICMAAAEGKLLELNVEFEKKATVCKYIVPKGYPDNTQEGKIAIPTCEKDNIKALTYYASVEEKNGELWTKKSRAVAFVGIADTIKQAEKIAEEAASKATGNAYHRRDIGTVEALERKIEHMKEVLNDE